MESSCMMLDDLRNPLDKLQILCYNGSINPRDALVVREHAGLDAS